MLSDKIKQLRTKCGISQSELGQYLSVSQQAIAKWEKGVAEPDSGNIKKIAERFDVSTDYLLGKSDNPNPPNSENFHVSDKALKFALWGREDVTDKQLERIKKFAKIIEDEDE